MKFRSTTGTDVHLSLTSGHSAVVTADGSELDQRFHREAIANGCLPDGIEESNEGHKPDFDRKQIISDALHAMLAGSDPEDFTKQGKPSMSKVNARVGFNVDRSEVDAIWEELSGA